MKYEDIVRIIARKSGKNIKDVERIVLNRNDEFSGRISAEGIAYIVAKELDVDVNEPVQDEFKTNRIKVSGLTEGQRGEIRGILVQVFESNVFYQSCSKCGLSLKDGKCSEHGPVEAKTGVVLNGVVDDGTGTSRIVFFKDNAEKLLGKNIDEMKNMFLISTKGFYNSIPLGKEFLFNGYCRKNKFFDKNEFIVNDIKNVDVEWEISSMF